VIRRFNRSLYVMAALAAAAIVCEGQSLPLLTHHVRDAVVNGEAKQMGRLPASQSMRLVLVLPLRNQETLDAF